MNELKLSILTILISAGIIIIAGYIFGSVEMIRFILGMILYLVIKREVRDMFGND